MPYFPYSKQSKIKRQRGSIVGKSTRPHRSPGLIPVIANLLTMAGVNHVITMDLHASQMQGFFTIPVDNLYAEPSLVRWIKEKVPDWESCVIVSKNPGGAKRVTSLADCLGVDFALTHMDRRRGEWSPSMTGGGESLENSVLLSSNDEEDIGPSFMDFAAFRAALPMHTPPMLSPRTGLNGTMTPRRANSEITTARLVSGHVIEEDYTGGSPRGMSVDGILNGRLGTETPIPSVRTGDEDSSVLPQSTAYTSTSSVNGDTWGTTSGLWGPMSSPENAQSDDEDDDAEILDGRDRTITLVGDVFSRTAIILDDIIDHPAGYIAAAEHLVKNCGAKQVIVMGTHGIFTDDAIEELEACGCIDTVPAPLP